MSWRGVFCNKGCQQRSFPLPSPPRVLRKTHKLLRPPLLPQVLGRVLGQGDGAVGDEVGQGEAGEGQEAEDAQHVEPGAVGLVVVLDARLGRRLRPGLLLQRARTPVLDELLLVVGRIELDDARLRVGASGRRLALAH